LKIVYKFAHKSTPAEGRGKPTLNDFDASFNFNTLEIDPNPLEKKFKQGFCSTEDLYQVTQTPESELFPAKA